MNYIYIIQYIGQYELYIYIIQYIGQYKLYIYIIQYIGQYEVLNLNICQNTESKYLLNLLKQYPSGHKIKKCIFVKY